MRHNAGFTLIEILTAVIIVTILVTMAVPLYEKTIERSRMAEARSILAKLEDAKLQTMDNMGCRTFDTNKASCPKVKHLNLAFTADEGSGYSFTTKDFEYTLNVPSHPNGVCAKRLGGDNADTLFVYLAPEAGNNEAAIFLCNGNCSYYGLPSNEAVSCTF